MACKYICDGCGKEENAYFTWERWKKPADWYQRPYTVSHHDACSPECVELIKKEFPDLEIIENIDVTNNGKLVISVKTNKRNFKGVFNYLDEFEEWEEFQRLSDLRDRIKRNPVFEKWEEGE